MVACSTNIYFVCFFARFVALVCPFQLLTIGELGVSDHRLKIIRKTTSSTPETVKMMTYKDVF